jgi:hypothetical protein
MNQTDLNDRCAIVTGAAPHRCPAVYSLWSGLPVSNRKILEAIS